MSANMSTHCEELRYITNQKASRYIVLPMALQNAKRFQIFHYFKCPLVFQSTEGGDVKKFGVQVDHGKS